MRHTETYVHMYTLSTHLRVLYPCVYRHQTVRPDRRLCTYYVACSAKTNSADQGTLQHSTIRYVHTRLQSEWHASLNEAFTHQQGMNIFLGHWLPWLRASANMTAVSTPQMLGQQLQQTLLSQTHNHTQHSTMDRWWCTWKPYTGPRT